MAKNEVAAFIKPQLARSCYVEPNLTGIFSRSNYKVVFELVLIAVIHQIYAGIEILILHLSVGGHMFPPLVWIIALVIENRTAHRIQALHLSVGICTHNAQTQMGLLDRAIGRTVRDRNARLWVSSELVRPERTWRELFAVIRGDEI